MRDAGNGSCAGHRRRRVDIGSAADRNVVAGDVGRIRNEALARGLDLRLIVRQRRAGIAVRDSLQALHGIGGIGLQRATEQLVVEARAKYPALAVVERRCELFVILDFGGQGLKFSGRGVVAGPDP